MKLLIHVGLPKCLSTSLQRGVFSTHPGINFMGVGVEDNISYQDSRLELISENLLKYSNHRTYSAQRSDAKQAIDDWASKDMLNVFSNEHLVFKFGLSQLDTYEKIERLKDLFSDFEVQILLLHRQFESLIRSLYKEFVRMGLDQSYNDYLIWLWNYRDRNFFDDLNADHAVQQLETSFGRGSVLQYDFESAASNYQEFINTLLVQDLKLSPIEVEQEAHNASLTDQQTYELLQLNKAEGRGLSAQGFEEFERHRNREWFEACNAVASNDYVFEPVVKKRESIERIRLTNDLDSSDLFSLNSDGEQALNRILEELN